MKSPRAPKDPVVKDALQRENVREVIFSLVAMTGTQREVFELYRTGLRVAEIAETIGFSTSTSRRRLHQAIRRIHSVLEDWEGFGQWGGYSDMSLSELARALESAMPARTIGNCTLSDCSNSFAVMGGPTGRPRLFCSNRCRQRAYRQRRKFGD